MDDTLKEELIELLYHDSFEFRVTPTHKGMELEIFGNSDVRNGKIREVIEEWACFGGLFEYLFRSSNCYPYECDIIAIDEGKAETYKIVDAEINIQIKGPNPDEFESIEMDFMNFPIADKLKLNSRFYGLEKFENEFFKVDFIIEEWQHVNQFELNYFLNDDILSINLDDNQRKIILDYIIDFAKSKEQQLDVNCSECYEMTCVSIHGFENKITYEVTEYYKFLYSDVFD